MAIKHRHNTQPFQQSEHKSSQLLLHFSALTVGADSVDYRA